MSAVRCQPCAVSRGPVCLPRCDVGRRGGRSVGGCSERRRRGGRASGPSGGQAGTGLAAQRRGGLDGLGAGAAAGGGGSVVGASASGVRRSCWVADSSAPRSLVEVWLFPRWGARSVPPWPPSVPLVDAIHTTW